MTDVDLTKSVIALEVQTMCLVLVRSSLGALHIWRESHGSVIIWMLQWTQKCLMAIETTCWYFEELESRTLPSSSDTAFRINWKGYTYSPSKFIYVYTVMASCICRKNLPMSMKDHKQSK